MRIYMLPVAVTATLMSAHLAQAGRVPRVPSSPSGQDHFAPDGKEQSTRPR